MMFNTDNMEECMFLVREFLYEKCCYIMRHCLCWSCVCITHTHNAYSYSFTLQKFLFSWRCKIIWIIYHKYGRWWVQRKLLIYTRNTISRIKSSKKEMRWKFGGNWILHVTKLECTFHMQLHIVWNKLKYNVNNI